MDSRFSIKKFLSGSRIDVKEARVKALSAGHSVVALDRTSGKLIELNEIPIRRL